MLNITRIPAPRVMLVDPQTGIVSDQWFRFLNNIYTIVGSNQGILQIINGGTGVGTEPANGQLLIGDVANGYVLNTLTPASGISVTNAPGDITITNTGVLSNIAGAGVSVSSATGDVTIANTGVVSTIAGAGVSVSAATGNVTIANTGVLSFSAGTTGLTPNAPTTGAVTLAGTLAVANGGTGGTDAATARTNLGLGTIAVKNIGVSGTFTTVDSKTVTVTDGIITSIV